MTQQTQELVKAFTGENRLLRHDLLPDNVSPDAQNVDYSRGTIRERKGYSKIHQRAMVTGGLRIDNDANNRAAILPDASTLDLDADFTLEIFVIVLEVDESASAFPDFITKEEFDVSAWSLFLNLTTENWKFRMVETGPNSVEASLPFSTVPVEEGARYHISVTRATAAVILTVTNLDDGTTGTATSTVTGTVNGTRPVMIGANGGATPQNQTIDYIADEVRIWKDVRTAAELADSQYRELNEEEVRDANLTGYWRLNDGAGDTVLDSSRNANHGFLSATNVADLVSFPLIDPNNQGVRFNGFDGGGTMPYRAALAPLLDTGLNWTVEFWMRLDRTVTTDSTILALGDFTTGKGSVFNIYVDSSNNLKYTYSTTTTDNNVDVDTTHNIVLGSWFHFALVREDGTIKSYINGVLVDTETVSGAGENGPTTSTTYGMTFGHRTSGGTTEDFCPCSMDIVRLWKTARSASLILNKRHTQSLYDPVDNISLLTYQWGMPEVDDADPDVTVTYLGNDDKPAWSRGIIYPLNPEPLDLTAPFTKVLGGEASAGRTVKNRAVLCATRTDFWLLDGTQGRFLSELPATNIFNDRYAHTLYRNRTICCNGLGRNFAYDGTNLPFSVTLPTWTDSVTVATSAGSGWPIADGEYKYRFAWYDKRAGVEGLYGGEESVTLATASHDEVDISGIAASLAGYPNVTHVRIYRLDPSTTVFRHHSDVAIGTTTATDTGTVITGNDAVNTRRGHPDPHRICFVYSNRLVLLNESDDPSSLTYSDANTEDFPGTNQLYVDNNDGDELAGGIAQFGGAVLWKGNSIHFLSGFGQTSFALTKVVDGIGCVSHNTIAASDKGVYFLAADGVYLFDGRNARYLSHSQQPEFLKLDRELARNAAGSFDPATHQYIVSFDTVDAGPGSIYDLRPDMFTGYWKLADTTDEKGTAALTLGSNATFEKDGERGGMVRIEGNGRNLSNVGDVTDLTTEDVTIGGWFREIIDASGVLALGSGGFILAENDTHRFEIILSKLTGGNISIATNISGTFAYDFPSDGKWHHVVVAHKGNHSQCLYVDGVLVAQGTTTATIGTISAFFAGQTASANFDGYLQNAFYIANIALTATHVKEIYEEEVKELLKKKRVTFSFDEETQAWDKWDKDFDTLVLAEQTSAQNDLLGARNGFIHKLLHGDRDGAGFLFGGPMGDSGTLSSETGPNITDSGALFPVEGDGLAGVEFVAVPDDLDANTIQRRRILYNTATEVQLNAALVPAVTGTYYIGPIDTYWETRWMDLMDPAHVKRVFRLLVWVTENTATVTYKFKTDENETFTSGTFSTADEFIEKIMNTRGRRLKLRFEHIATDETFEIESFQTLYELRGIA